jgi:hypothetical protein
MPTSNTRRWLSSKLQFTSPEQENKFFSYGIGKSICSWLDDFHREASKTKLQGDALDEQVIKILRVIYPKLLPSEIRAQKSKEYELIKQKLFNYFSRSISTKQLNPQTNGTQ